MYTGWFGQGLGSYQSKQAEIPPDPVHNVRQDAQRRDDTLVTGDKRVRAMQDLLTTSRPGHLCRIRARWVQLR